MKLYEVIQITQVLEFDLCFTKHGNGFYFPAPALSHCTISKSLRESEVCVFTIDFENNVVFASLKGDFK